MVPADDDAARGGQLNKLIDQAEQVSDAVLLEAVERMEPHQARDLLEFRSIAGRFWTVRSKSRGRVPMTLTRAQELVEADYLCQMEDRGYVRQNILKCRQVGMSTYWTRKALLFAMHNEATTAFSIAHLLDLPIQWLSACRWNYAETPRALRPEQTATQGLRLAFANDSRYYIGSAQGSFPGMGDTIQFSHKSEAGRWDKPPISKDPDEVLIPLAPTMPTGDDIYGSVDVYESTGVMVGDWWWRKWMSGKDDEDEYHNLFLPWFLVETYRRDDLVDDVLARSADEQVMAREAERYGITLTDSQLAWYRHELRQPPYNGNESEFRAEYPATETEAFMSPGSSIYTPEAVKLARATCGREVVWKGNLHGTDKAPSQAQRVKNPYGECTVLEYPDPRLHYVIGADCMWGRRKENDWDYLHVECLETGKVAAWLKGQFLMSEWAWKIAAMGFWYNTCTVAPERNAQAGSASDGVIATLLGTVVNWRYPNLWVRSPDMRLRGFRPQDYGWLTDHATKGQLIAFSERETMNGGFDWADSEAVDQMATIIRHADNSIGAPEGMHDDAWMSRLITAMVAHRVRPNTNLHIEAKPQVFVPTSIERRLALMDEEVGP